MKHNIWAAAALAMLLAALNGCGKTEHAGSSAPRSRPAAKKPPAPELAKNEKKPAEPKKEEKKQE